MQRCQIQQDYKVAKLMFIMVNSIGPRDSKNPIIFINFDTETIFKYLKCCQIKQDYRVAKLMFDMFYSIGPRGIHDFAQIQEADVTDIQEEPGAGQPIKLVRRICCCCCCCRCYCCCCCFKCS